MDAREVFIPSRLFGIIGHPLGHSLSPLVHNDAFRRAGLPYVYMAFPVEPSGLDGLMAGVRTLPVSGLSVTIPHKTAVMAHVDELTDLAGRVGAVNTLFWENGRLVGDNTDVEGFLSPLRERGLVPERAVVLGAGGAAKACLAGLAQLGTRELYVAARDKGKARALAEEQGARAWGLAEAPELGADLVVNATPLGMKGEREGLSPYPAAAWRPGQVAYDLVYNPLTTRFLADAGAAGATAVDGLSMFVGQAVLQFRRFTGGDMDQARARELVRSALGLG